MKRFPRYLMASIFALLIGGLPGGTGIAAADPAGYTIKAISLEQEQDKMLLRIGGDSPPTFTTYMLFDPPRVVIDIAEAELGRGAAMPSRLSRGLVRAVETRMLARQKPLIFRVEAILAANLAYHAEQNGNDIVVTIFPPAKAPSATATPVADRSKQSPLGGQDSGDATAAIIADLKKYRPPQGVIEAVTPQLLPQEKPALSRPAPAATPAKPAVASKRAAASASPARAASRAESAVARIFDDYDHQKISVEFFKTDLHNVFRFFGEISQRNIVVDEAVSGNLTLTLNEVPWDFALDIVLNLKNLQKEERYNTIVISPRAKTFVWPERASDRIRVRADGVLEQVDAIAVTQRLELPREQVEARELIRQAAALDKRGAHPEAMAAYEKALELWPDNSQLAERLANLNLVQFGNNPRALHFARQALRHDPDRHQAALIAAIAAANMQRGGEAKAYFDRAINSPRPQPEALISYAAFAEEHDSPHGALALLARHNQLYGDNLETMITRARLLDQTGAGGPAVNEYRAILFSGYELPEDLRRYIQARIAADGERGE
jgi:type IV pilus assembly protein PilQ